MGHHVALQAAAGLQDPLRHQALHTAADSSSSQATLAVLQAAGSAKSTFATMHCRLQHTAVSIRTIVCSAGQGRPGPSAITCCRQQ